MYDAPIGASQYPVSEKVHFQIMAPRAYVTYYQTRGLSGHTSPYGEYAYFFDPYALFTLLTFLFSNTSGHTSPGRKSFSLSQEHHIFFEQPTSPATVVVGCISS
jgi:hypothetical protein